MAAQQNVKQAFNWCLPNLFGLRTFLPNLQISVLHSAAKLENWGRAPSCTLLIAALAGARHERVKNTQNTQTAPC